MRRPPARGSGPSRRSTPRRSASIAPHFEHRLFLSATPHNGYRESFWALLEMLDPQRFSRMLEPSKESLRRGMVLRTKRQLRIEPGEEGFDHLRNFAKPEIVALSVSYTDDEREAHRRLETYTTLRDSGASAEASRPSPPTSSALSSRRVSSHRQRRSSTRSSSTSGR